MGIFYSKTIFPSGNGTIMDATVSKTDIFSLIELNKTMLYYKNNLDKYEDKEKLIADIFYSVNLYNQTSTFNKITSSVFALNPNDTIRNVDLSERLINLINQLLKSINDKKIKLIDVRHIGYPPICINQSTERFKLLNNKYIKSGKIVLDNLKQYYFYEYIYELYYICKYFNSDKFISDLIVLEGVNLPSDKYFNIDKFISDLIELEGVNLPSDKYLNSNNFVSDPTALEIVNFPTNKNIQ